MGNQPREKLGQSEGAMVRRIGKLDRAASAAVHKLSSYSNEKQLITAVRPAKKWQQQASKRKIKVARGKRGN